MFCYNCGCHLSEHDFRTSCGADVSLYKKIMCMSNRFYNDGLEKAGVRDLTGAINSLRQSLKFNKNNIEARNLLGLVYFETGEVVAALSEWVISKNMRPEKNIADDYINMLQSNAARLDAINQTIKKYNQALLYCKQNSRDLAIIQLKKVLSLNPKLVSGHQLLALLYIQEGRYDLAKKSLRNAGKIDANNTVTLRYLKEANAALREQNPSKKQKNDELISYQSGNETIIQPKYLKDNSAVGTIINMVIGIAIGIAITCFLVVPGVRRTVMNNTKAEVLDANNTISSKNQTITSLQSQVDDLTSQITDAKNSEEESANKLESYDKLLTAYETYTTGDIEKAGDALSSVNVDDLSADAKSIYDTINAQVNAEYMAALYKEGYDAYSGKKYDDAVSALSKVVEMDENYENGNALYYLAQAYRKNEDMENAKIYYQKVVELYPNTERAANSQNYLDQSETDTAR